MNESAKEVYFNKYCCLCEYELLNEVEEPCLVCLDRPFNTFSHKPIKYKEKVKYNGSKH